MKSVAQICRIKPIRWTCGHYTTSGGRSLTEHEYNVLIRMLEIPCGTPRWGVLCDSCLEKILVDIHSS